MSVPGADAMKASNAQRPGSVRSILAQVIELADDAPQLTDPELADRLVALAGWLR